MHDLIKECRDEMGKRLSHFEKELTRVRTGRASVSMLDGVRVNYYGAPTPLNQVASLSTPDARTVLISPFEKKLLGEIEKAIHMASLGVQPNNDGNVIRLPIPPLTEERRKDIAKSIRRMGEETKVHVRQARQDINARIKKLEKDKELSEDVSKQLQKDVQTATDDFIKKVGERVDEKEQEILTM